jgi:lipid kinase YegS
MQGNVETRYTGGEMKNMKTILLILHEKAESDAAVQKATERMRDLGYDIRRSICRASGDAAALAEWARREKVDVVVAGGGDGTLNEVVNGVFRTDESPRIAIGVLPLGTGNDFAKSCGIPEDPYQALLLAADGSPVMIDVGKANDRYFLNMVSCGFGAEVTSSTPPALKKAIGGGAYSLVGLVTALKAQPYEFRLITPEGEERGKAMMMAVANGRQAGGGYQVAPNALLDDGLLDVVLVREFALRDMNAVVRELNALGEAEGRYLLYKQLPSFSMETAGEIAMTIDGEPARAQSVRFETLHRRLPFILPEKTALIRDYHQSAMAA